MTYSLRQKILAEFIGTYFLVLTVVGSGIMGELISNDLGIILLGNTIATGAILYVIISMFINQCKTTRCVLLQYSTEHIQPQNLAITVTTFIIDKFN